MNYVYEVNESQGSMQAISTLNAGGPWNPQHQHGAAPTALICWAVERIPTLAPMQVARITVDLLRPVPAAVWFRAERPIIVGETISPLMRAAIAGDFCNGTASLLDFRHWTFINGDLNIHLARMPVGEWILLDAESYVGPAGVGVAFARLGDLNGYFGRAAQSLVIEPRMIAESTR